MINLINKAKLIAVNRKQLGYPLHIAEKDYFLTIVMQIVSESKLATDLIFKGGTAIHHCYLNQLRFSEDLDFNSITKQITTTQLKQIFSPHQIFEIKKQFASSRTIKLERLKYYGVLDIPNSIKIEIDKLQSTILPTVKKTYHNHWGLNFKVNVMDKKEICAEKIRACNERFRYRDFYDLFLLINTLNIDLESVINILQQKERRKPMSHHNLLEHLQLALQEVSDKADTIKYTHKIPSQQLIDFFQKLPVPDLKIKTG